MRLEQIQEQVGNGAYQVNPRAVAEAILRRLLAAPRPAGPPPDAQEECS
jgi:hypothetical protein